MNHVIHPKLKAIDFDRHEASRARFQNPEAPLNFARLVETGVITLPPARRRSLLHVLLARFA